MAIDGDGENTRVSVSLSTLRAELGSLELRLVDRLNGALQNKADRAVLDQVVARQSDGLSRLSLLEASAVRREGPIINRLETVEEEMTGLKEVGKYKRWLWAQTIALVAIAVPVLLYAIDSFVRIHTN